MGLLKPVKDVPGIDYYEYREIDYWDKFRYRARLILPGVRYTYWAKDITEWKELVSKSRYNYYSGGPTKQKKLELLANEQVISKFLDFKNKHSKSKEKSAYIRIEGETTAIFSNDLVLLQELKDWKVPINFTEVVKNQFSGVKYFTYEPIHNYRVYFKSKRVEQNVQSELRHLLNKNKSLTPSNAFNKWLYGSTKNLWKSRWMSSAYFIDYNDESTLSYLALMHGDLLGRKYKLEKRPDPI